MTKVELRKKKLRLTAIKEVLAEGNLSIEALKDLYNEQFELYLELNVAPVAKDMVEYGATFENEVDLLSLVSNRLFIEKYGMQGVS
jgi:hypothetical protein